MLEKLLPILTLGGDRNKAAQGYPIKDMLPGRCSHSLCRGYNGRIHRTQPVSLIFFSRSRLHPKSAIPSYGLETSPVLGTSARSIHPAHRLDSVPRSGEGSADQLSTAFAAASLVSLPGKNNTAKQEAAPHGSTPPGHAPMTRLATSGALPGRETRVHANRLDENLTFQ